MQIGVFMHELDMTTGQPAVFVTGTPAWHKLGQVVANAVTSTDAIELARLNWEVEQWELKAFDRELGKEALVRKALEPSWELVSRM